MSTRSFVLSSYDISPSDDLVDYYKQTVTTPTGTVADNRMSLTWNNVNLQQLLGNDFYNAYNRFTIQLVDRSWDMAPSSFAPSFYRQYDQDSFLNVYLKGLPFYPPIHNSPDGALVYTLYNGLLDSDWVDPDYPRYPRNESYNSIRHSFLKTSSATITINMRCVGTELPYNPGDVSTYLWGHSEYTFQVKGIVDVSNVSYLDLSNSSVLSSGTRTIYTELTPTDSINYVSSLSISSIMITQSTSSITFAPSVPTNIVYETDLSNVLVTIVGEQNGATLAGTTQYYLDSTFTNEVTVSSVLAYGSYTIYALFTPSSNDYSSSSASTSLIVTQKSTSVVYTQPPSIVYGTTIASSLTASCIAPGSIAYYYDASFTQLITSTDVNNFGTYTIYAVFSPSTNNYLSSSTSVTLTVTKATTTLTYSALSAITYGTTIGASLSASVSPLIAGTTNYYLDSANTQLISSSAVLNASEYTIYAVFTPASSNYTSSNANQSITVNKQATSITFPNISSFVYETTLSAFISGTTKGDVAGTLAFYLDNASGASLTSSTVLEKGTYTIFSTFTPTDTTNYLASSNTKSLTVTVQSTAIAFAPSIPSSIIYSTTLSDILSTTVTPNTAGIVSYYYVNQANANVDVSSTSVLNVGTYTIHALFTPAVDDYAVSSTTTSVTVTQASTSVSFSGLSSIVYQTTLASSLNASVSPSVSGTFNYYLDSSRTTEVFSTTVLNASSYTIYAFFTSSNANYTSSSQSTSIEVTKVTPVLQYDISASPIVYGNIIATFLTATVTTDISGTMSYFLDSEHTLSLLPTDILSAGSPTIYALFTPFSTSNYETVSISKSVTISKKSTAVTFPATSSITYETTLGAFISGTTSGGVAGIFQFTANGNAVTSATVLSTGTYTIGCTFTPTDATNYLSSTNTKSLTVSTQSTSLTFAPTIPTSIVYGTTLAQVLNTVLTPNVDGSLNFYTDIQNTQKVHALTVLSASATSYTIYAVFTPASSDYSSSTANTSLTVTKATTSVTYPTLANVVYGTPMSSCFTAFVTPSVTGAFTYYYMDGETKTYLSTTDILSVGSYTVFVDFISNISNYLPSSSQQSLTVTAAPTTVIYNTPSSIVFSAPLESSLTATAFPNIDGTLKYYIDSSEVTATTVLNAGVYSISAVFTPTNSNYSSSTTIKSLTVSKKSTTIGFPSNSSIVYETTLADLFAGTSTGIAGTYSFFKTDLSGVQLSSSTVLDAGSYTIYCKFIPTDSANYLSSEATKSFSVVARSTSLSYSATIPSSIVYNTTLASILVTTPTPNVAGTTTYKIDDTVVTSATVLDVGTYTILATFVPTEDEYSQSSVSTIVSVTPASSTLTFTIASSIVYGTTLNSSLTATSNKVGTISYFYDSSYTLVANANDTPTAGSYTIYALFTPTSSNDLSSNASASLTVTKQSTSVALSPATITYESTLATVLNASVTPSIEGITSYYYLTGGSTRVDLSSSDVLDAGNYTVNVDFTPTDLVNYLQSSSSTSLLVSQKTITVTYSDLSAITYGQTLSSRLTATLSQSVDGSLNYYLDSAKTTQVTSDASLNAGTYTLYAFFTPTSSNYVSYQVNTSLVINKATPTITYESLPSITYGTTLQSSFIASISPNVAGSVSYYLLGDLLSSSQILSSGSYTIEARFLPNDTTNYNSASLTTSLQVLKQIPTITFGSSTTTSIVYGTTLASFISETTVPVSGSLSFRLNDASGDLLTSTSVLSASSANYTIFSSFVPNDTSNYLSTSATTSITVQKQSTSVTLSTLNNLIYGETLATFINGTTSSVDGLFSFRLDDASGQLLTTSSILSAATYTIYCAFVPTDTSNYLSSYSTKSLTVQKHSTSVTLSTLNNLIYGETLAAFINGTTSSVDGSFSFHLNDASGDILTSSSLLNAATYTIYCAFLPSDASNYLQSSATKTLVVQKHGTSITLASTRTIVYGTSLASFVNGTTASIDGSIKFQLNDASGQLLTSETVLTAATYTIYCAFTPTDATNYSESSVTTSFVVQKQDTSITLSSLSTIVYGSTLASFISGTSASVVGSFSFFLNDASGELLTSTTVLNASASYTIYCAFTPSDTANYLSSSSTKSLTVQKQTTAITLSSLSSIVYGSTLSNFITGTTASVDGSFSFYLNDVLGQLLTSETVLNASASYTIYCAFTPSDTANYLSSSSTKSLTVQKQTTAITLPSLSSIVYGSNLSSFITGTSASVAGSFSFYLNDASGELLTSETVLSAFASYTIYCEFVPTDTTNYLSSSSTKTLAVQKQTTTITLPSLSSIVYGSNLSSFITGTTASVAGSFSFFLNDASGELLTSTTVLNASANYTIYCAFVPADTTNYLSSSSTKTLAVQKQTTTITLSSLSSIVYGSNLSSFITGTSASVEGSFSFYLNDASGELLTNTTVLTALSSYTIYCTFVPGDTSNYLSSSSTKSLTVQKQTTAITLPSLSSIVYGSNFSSFITGTTASVDGSFRFFLNDASGELLTTTTVLDASANYTIYCEFTPSDTANYLSSSSTKSFTVDKQTTTISLPSVTSIVYGSTFSTFISGSTASVDGSLNFYINNVNGQRLTESTILNAASYTIYCDFQPTDKTNYLSSSQTSLLEIEKQTTSVTLSSTSSITYGDSLAAFIGDTTSSVGGTFTFHLNNASGDIITSTTLLNAGSFTVYCAFTPSDTTNYLSSFATKSLTVEKQTTSIALAPMNSWIYGETFASFISQTTAPIVGTFTFYIDNANGQQLTESTVLSMGSYTIFCLFLPTDSSNYLESTASKTIQVSKQSTSFTLSAINTITYGTTLESFINGTTADISGVFSFYVNGQVLTSSTVLNASSYSIFCQFTPSDTSNYFVSSATKTLLVLKQSSSITLSLLSSITYGETLAGLISGSTASVDGSLNFSLNDVSGQVLTSSTILNAATYTIYASFVPSDTTNYLTTSTTKSFQVEKHATSVTLPTAVSTIVYGTTMASFISGTTSSVGGLLNFYINDASGQHITETTVLTSAIYTIYCSFTPSDTTNYLSSSSSATLTVEKQTTAISPSSLSTITYGDTLSAFISGTSASVDGSLNFFLNDASGQLLTTNTTLDASASYTIYCEFVPADTTNYLASSATASLTVEKHATSVTLSSITTLTYGETLSAFISGSSASVDGSLNFFLNDASGELLTTSSLLNASETIYTIYCAFTPSDATNYLTSSATKSLTVQKQSTSITLSSISTLTYGETISSFMSGSSASVNGSLNFFLNDAAGQLLTTSTILNAQNYTIYCEFVPTDTTNYLSSSSTKTLLVQKQSTAITLSSITTLTYGETLSAFISGSSASVDGSLSFFLNDASGQLLSASTVLNASASSYTIYCMFVPTDTTNYLSSSSTKQLVVTKADTVLTLSPISGYEYGDLFETFISSTTASVDGSFNFYIGDSAGQILTGTTILDAATYTIYCTFVPRDASNFNSSVLTKSIVVSRADTTVTMSPISTIVYGDTLSAFIGGTTSSTTGSFSFFLNDASGELLTTNTVLDASASYTIYCAFVPSDTTNYLSSFATKSLVVEKHASVVTLSSINSFVYGSTLSAFISETVASIDGSFSFHVDDASGQLLTASTILSASTYAIFCAFTPSDATNYLSSSATKSLVVYKQDTSITLPTVDAITYETSFASFINGTTSSVDGSFNFYINNETGQLLNATTVLTPGTYTIYCVFNPSDTVNFSSSTSSKTLVVNKRSSSITLSSVSSITYGTTLQTFINGFTASVAGSFEFHVNDASGELLTETTLLTSASYTIYCEFVPTDASNYLNATFTTPLSIQKQHTSVTLSSISSLTYGDTFAAFINGSTASTGGSLSFFLNDASGDIVTAETVLNASASYTIYCVFVPTDGSNYLTSTATKSLVVQKQASFITLSSVNSFISGDTLSAFISGCTASVVGSFSFFLNNASGEVLTAETVLNPAASSYTIYCEFTPTDASNYLPSSATKTLTVQKRVKTTPTITLSSLNSIVYETTLATFIAETTASVAGSFTFYLNDESGDILTSSTVLNVGTYTIYCAFIPNNMSNYLPSSDTKSLQVLQKTPTITLSSLSTLEYGSTMESFITGTTASVLGTFSYDISGQSITSSTVLDVALYTIVCSFVPTDTANYANISDSKQLTVTQKPLTVTYGALPSITYGSSIYSRRLNATVSPIVDGSMNYSILSTEVFASTVPDAAGTFIITATFTPSSANYMVASATSSLVVNKAATFTTYPVLENVLYNTAIGAASLSATVSPAVDGLMAYFTDSAFTNQVYSGSILDSGSYTLYARFTPQSSNYTASSASSSLVVMLPIAPTITFPNITTVAVYTPLESFITGTTTGVDGTFVFRKNNSSGAVLTTTSTFSVLGDFTIYCDFTPVSTSYLSASASYTVKVKFTPTLLFTQRPSSVISYGTNLSGSALSTTLSQFNNATIPGTITFSNSITASTFLTPGIYTVNATFTPTNLDYFDIATTSKQIMVSKQPLTVNITSPTVKSAFINSAPIDCSYQVWGILTALGDTIENSLTGTFANKYYTFDGVTELTANYVYTTTFEGTSQTYKIASDISGFSSSKYDFTPQMYTFTVNKYTPTITYTISTPNKTLPYSTPLGANQLNAVVSYNGTPITTGSVVYTQSAINLALTVDSTTVFDVGQYNLYAYFSDPVNKIYNSVNTSTVSTNRITVSKATPIISIPSITSFLSGTNLANIFDFTLASFNSVNIDGTFVFSYVNQSGATVVVNSTTIMSLTSSSVTINVSFTPADYSRYNNAVESITLSITDFDTVVTATSLLQSPFVYGKTFNDLYSFSVSPSTAGTYAYYNDVVEFNPASILDVGTYTYTVIFNPTSSSYASSFTDVAFTIENATMTLAYLTPPSYVYQTVNQLSLLQPTKSVAVDGSMQIFLDSSFTNELTNATPMSVGTHTLYARFSPLKNYNVATTTTTLTVTQIPTSWAQPTETLTATYGSNNASILANRVSSVVGSIPGSVQYYYDISFTQTVNSVEVLDFGTYTFYGRFVPTSSNYAPSFVTYTVLVSKRDLTMAYTTLSPIHYGTSLQSSFTASSTFDGSINYFVNGSQVFANTQLDSGSYTITATFTPSKPTNFTTPSVSLTQALTVIKRSTALTYTPANIISGTTFGPSMTATVSPSIPGIKQYFINNEEVLSETVLDSGIYTMLVTFTPTNVANYTSSTVTVPVTVMTDEQFIIFTQNIQQIQGASNNETVQLVSQNALMPPTIDVKVNVLTTGQPAPSQNVVFTFLDQSMNSGVKSALSTFSVNLPTAANSPAIYFKFYDPSGISVISATNRVSLTWILPQFKGITQYLYLLRMLDIGADFDGTRHPLIPVDFTDPENITFTAIFRSNSTYVAVYLPPPSIETPLESNVYAFEATGGFIMQRGFDDIKQRELVAIETFDVTDSVQVLFDVALFNAKLGLNKNEDNDQIVSSQFNPVTDQFEANGSAIDSLTLSASEFVSGVNKSQQIISVGKYSTVYSDFQNYVATYFGYDGGFSSLFTAASEFAIDTDNHFDSESMRQLFMGVPGNGAYVNQMIGTITISNITASLRHCIDSNCFGNRDPIASSGSAVDPIKSANYGVEDGFVAGDLIWIPTGTTLNLNLNIDMESFMPVNNVGPENISSSQSTNFTSGNFSQDTTATTTNIHRTVRAPLLIKLVNGSTINSL